MLGVRSNVHDFNTSNNRKIDDPQVRLEKLRSGHVIMGLKLYSNISKHINNLDSGSVLNITCLNYKVKTLSIAS